MSLARTTRMRCAAAALAGLAGAVLATPAHSGGLSRPNIVSVRGTGMGGAFGALADDPSALHHNPAGMALMSSTAMVGMELVYAPRSYEPLLPDGSFGPAEEPNTPIFPLPTLGFVHRLRIDDMPSRFAFGMGVWVPWGAALSWDPFLDADGNPDPGKPAINSITNATVELVPGFAYAVNDVLSIGAALRLGIGVFAVDTTAKPLSADLSASGLGLGATVGALLTPSKRIRIGAVYRSPLRVRTKGDGTIFMATGPDLSVDVEHLQRWPDTALLSVAVLPTEALTLAAQVDWTGWSLLDSIDVEFPSNPDLDQRYETDWNDTYAVHLGGQYDFGGAAARLGWTYDTAAAIERTLERQYADADKMTFNIGASFALGGQWAIDLAFELVPEDSRVVEDNRAELTAEGWANRANLAPGRHGGGLYTFDLAARYRF